MKHFKRILTSSANRALPLVRQEVVRNEQLWLLDQSRQANIPVQRETQSIPLRSAKRRNGDKRNSEDIEESQLTRFAAFFPFTMSFLAEVATIVGGTLERALYVRLLPHSVVYPHIDGGAYYAVRDRYHYVVISDSGSSLTSGGEQIIMQPGELWWFDNKAIHESANLSNECRVHLIFDVF